MRPAERARRISHQLVGAPSGLCLQVCAAEGERFLQGSSLVPGTARVTATGLGFGEGPRIRQGTLMLSDIPAGKIYTLAADKLVEVLEIPGDTPSGIGSLPNGDLLITGQHSGKVTKFAQSSKSCTTHCDLSGYVQPGGFINDAVADAKGNFYVGVDPPLGKLSDAPQPGKLVLVKPYGTSTVVCNDFPGFANGVVITPDGKTMICADTTSQNLRGFDIAADGSLSNSRVWADLGGCAPNGICLDAENCVWCACPFVPRAKLETNNTIPKHFPRTKEGPRYSCFLRVAEGGEVKDVIELESQMGIACALGYAAAAGQGGLLYMVECKKLANEPPADTTNGRISTIQVKVGPARIPGDQRYSCGYWS